MLMMLFGQLFSVLKQYDKINKEPSTKKNTKISNLCMLPANYVMISKKKNATKQPKLSHFLTSSYSASGACSPPPGEPPSEEPPLDPPDIC